MAQKCRLNPYFARAYSSVGRAPVLHTGGHRFESCCAQAYTCSYAGVVQLVRAPPCHGGSCGFEPRLPRIFFLLVLFSLCFASCSPQSLDDFHEEGGGIVNALIAELKQIRSRDDLLQHTSKLQQLFNALVDVMIRAREYKDHHPEAALESLRPKEQLAADQLRIELNRILNIEGGREVIEKAQEEALNHLEAAFEAVLSL